MLCLIYAIASIGTFTQKKKKKKIKENKKSKPGTKVPCV
jgi:hypothetical protein